MTTHSSGELLAVYNPKSEGRYTPRPSPLRYHEPAAQHQEAIQYDEGNSSIPPDVQAGSDFPANGSRGGATGRGYHLGEMRPAEGTLPQRARQVPDTRIDAAGRSPRA